MDYVKSKKLRPLRRVRVFTGFQAAGRPFLSSPEAFEQISHSLPQPVTPQLFRPDSKNQYSGSVHNVGLDNHGFRRARVAERPVGSERFRDFNCDLSGPACVRVRHELVNSLNDPHGDGGRVRQIQGNVEERHAKIDAVCITVRWDSYEDLVGRSLFAPRLARLGAA